MKSRIYTPSLKSFLKLTAINNSPMKDKIKKDLHVYVGESPICDFKGKIWSCVDSIILCSAEATAVLVLHNHISLLSQQCSFTS